MINYCFSGNIIAQKMFSYILDPSYDKGRIIESFSEALELEATVVTDAFHSSSAYDQSPGFRHVSQVSEEKWLAYFCNSDFIVTDSFHGVCIALLFHKDFIALCNSGRGATRFESLLGQLGLTERLVYDLASFTPTDACFQPIDYNSVDAILNELREKSMQWLLDALSAKKPSRVTDLDVVREDIDSLRIQISHLRTFFGALEQRICLIEQFARDLEGRTSAVESTLNKPKHRK